MGRIGVRMRAMAFSAILILGAAFLPVALSLRTPGEENSCQAAMKLLDEAVAGFESWEGRFTHSVYFNADSRAEIEEGKLLIGKNGKMRWEYSAPKGKLAISDGRTVWLYVADEKRAYRLKVPPQKYLPVPVRLLLGKTLPSKEFFCADATSESGTVTIELGFKEKNVGCRRLKVAVSEKDKSIAGISYVDEFDNRVEFSFSGGKKGGKVNPAVFSFTPPPGTRITEDPDEELQGQF